MIRDILKYILVFFILVLVLTGTLTLVSTIPREKIEKNIELSTPYLSRRETKNYINRYHPILWLDLWPDEVMFSIIYNIDTSTPLKSVMESKYFETEEHNLRLQTQLQDKRIEANTEYIRYWHGMMIYIRPLLVFFSIHGIFIINAIIMGIIFTVLMIMLLKRKQFAIAIAFVIAFIMTGIALTPFCLEYMWVFLIMMVTSIMAIKMEKNNRKLYMLFFITGILTCFFDFLTAELVTILVPLLVVLGLRRDSDAKENIKFLIFSLIIWFIGYACMWLAKWILASLVLKINAFDYVKEKMIYRIEPKFKDRSMKEIYRGAIINNFVSLYPFTFFKNKLCIIVVLVVAILIFIGFRKRGNIKNIVPFLLIIILPYVRYLVLANHSFCHYFFMFREQFPAIMGFILLFAYGTDKKLMFKEIKLKEEKN